MTQTIPISDLFQHKVQAADVELFDPPMCCPTGMCGPTIDQTLLDVNEMMLTLQSRRGQRGALPDDQSPQCLS